MPYTEAVIKQIPSHVPVIHFTTGNPALLPHVAQAGGSVIGLDWRVRLDEGWKTVGLDRAVQGNLDPAVLMAEPDVIRKHVKEILNQAGGRPGHIFNLGHGVLPKTPVENVRAMIAAVREFSAR
jgi:uroporphyrinogen-III decarboxylase